MNFLFACGGTAGHINPALAVAGRLRELINARFDERIAKYERGEKLWDFSTSTVLAVSGVR